MVEYTFSQLVDIAQVRQLLESHSLISRMAYAVLDTDENMLIDVGWRDVCVKHLRVNPVSCAHCLESDANTKKHLPDSEGDCLEYRCNNGLIDFALPIIVDGVRLATFRTGQFFYDGDRPDAEFFRNQAEGPGLKYLNALEQAPVLTRELASGTVLFLRDMVKVLAETGLKNLKLVWEVEEIKRIDKELRESEQKYRTMAHNAPDSIGRYDRQGRIVFLNPLIERNLQRPLADLIGKRSSEAYPDGLFDALEQVILDVAATGEDASFEQTIPGDDGPQIHLLHLTAEREADGEVTGVLAVARDITEQRRVEERLTTSERDFRTLAENSPTIIIRYDRECRRVYVNTAYMLETGTSFDQAVGMPLERDWFPDMPVEEFKAKLRRIIETGVADDMLLEWTSQDGQLYCHAIQAVAERDSKGEVTGCLAIGRNITLLKEAEQRLAKLAENSPGAMYSFLLRADGTSCMPYVSAHIEELIGLRPDELALDMSETYARIHPDDAARLQESIAESARTLSPWHAEYRTRHPEKGELWLEGRAMPEPEQDGATLWYGFLHDITERKRMDESLRAKRDQLATMSVELSLAEERERRRIASELHDHIGQTLLLSRIKLGTLADVSRSGRDEKTYGEIQSLLDQTIRDVRSLTQQLNPPVLASLGIEAALEWLARRMEADYSLLVEFAADRNEKQLTEELSAVVYQSVRELLINVTKHSGTGKAWLTISRDADLLVVAVEDQGIGFASLPDAGTNMPLDCSFGLFNIRQRIKYLGGSVMVDSTPGNGTRATIRVPAVVGR